MAKSSFERLADRWIENVFHTNPVDVPDVLYHYTDAAGLAGMLQSGVVWATDLRFLNDRQEQRHFCGASRTFIDSMLAGDCSQETMEFCAQILRFHSIASSDHRFVFSLSADADDLSQWRGYGREGRGFTVGFDGKVISRLAEPKNAPFGFAKVEYNHDRQSLVISRIFQEFMEEIRKLKLDADAHDFAEYARWYDYAIENCATLNKHQSFVREGEWRIVAVLSDENKQHIKVRTSTDRLIPYLELDFDGDENDKLPIVSVGIGPGFVESDEEHAVRSLCRQHGYELDVYFADTPYRRP